MKASVYYMTDFFILWEILTTLKILKPITYRLTIYYMYKTCQVNLGQEKINVLKYFSGESSHSRKEDEMKGIQMDRKK